MPLQSIRKLFFDCVDRYTFFIQLVKIFVIFHNVTLGTISMCIIHFIFKDTQRLMKARWNSSILNPSYCIMNQRNRGLTWCFWIWNGFNKRFIKIVQNDIINLKSTNSSCVIEIILLYFRVVHSGLCNYGISDISIKTKEIEIKPSCDLIFVVTVHWFWTQWKQRGHRENLDDIGKSEVLFSLIRLSIQRNSEKQLVFWEKAKTKKKLFWHLNLV